MDPALRAHVLGVIKAYQTRQGRFEAPPGSGELKCAHSGLTVPCRLLGAFGLHTNVPANEPVGCMLALARIQKYKSWLYLCAFHRFVT